MELFPLSLSLSPALSVYPPLDGFSDAMHRGDVLCAVCADPQRKCKEKCEKLSSDPRKMRFKAYGRVRRERLRCTFARIRGRRCPGRRKTPDERKNGRTKEGEG